MRQLRGGFCFRLRGCGSRAGHSLVWATVPYENPSLFHKEVVVSLILVAIAALIHWNIYGLGRLWELAL